MELTREDLIEIRQSREQTDSFVRNANFELQRVGKRAGAAKAGEEPGEGAVTASHLREVLESEPHTEIPPEFRQEEPRRENIGQPTMDTSNKEFSVAISQRKPHPPMIYQVPLDRPLLLHFSALEDQRRISGEPRPGARTEPGPFATIFSKFGNQEEQEEKERELHPYVFGMVPSPSPREESAKKIEDRKEPTPHGWKNGYPYDGPQLHLLDKKVEADFVPAVHEKTTVALTAKFEGNRARRDAGSSPRPTRRWC